MLKKPVTPGGDTPPVKPPDQSVESRISKIESSVDQIAQAVALLLRKDDPPKPVDPPAQTPLGRERDEESTKDRIIPQSWLDVLHKNLGKDFTFELHEGGSGSFAVRVIFPVHIDRRVGTEKSNGPRDVSMFSPIRLASPLDDLAAWCKLCVQTIKKTSDHINFTPKN